MHGMFRSQENTRVNKNRCNQNTGMHIETRWFCFFVTKLDSYIYFILCLTSIIVVNVKVIIV